MFNIMLSCTPKINIKKEERERETEKKERKKHSFPVGL